MRQMLRSLGYRRVLEAGEPAEAIAILKEELVDLALLPWEVPGWSGRALFKAMQHKGRNRGVPVILLDSGLPQSAVVAAVKAGAAGRLTLPARRADLRSLLLRVERGDAARAIPGTGEEEPDSR